jgi:hypothetical protein
MKSLAIFLVLAAFPWAPVLGLFGIGGPSAILGAVVPVDINPVNLALFEKGRIHVRNEFIESMPAFANRYSSGSVMGESFIFGSIASTMHSAPSAIQRVLVQSVLGGRIELTAATTLNGTILQLIDSHQVGEGATRTATDSGVSIGANSFAYDLDGQAPKGLPDLNTGGRERLKAEVSEIHDVNRFRMNG